MASFISALSLFVLVLATGCFAFPVNDEQFSSTITPSFIDHFTTGKTVISTPQSFDLRLVPDEETTDLPTFPSQKDLQQHFRFESSTPVHNQELEENFTQTPRSFDELSTSASYTHTTQGSDSKLEHSERSFDDFSSTIESSTQLSEHHLRSIKDDEDENESNKLSEREFQLELTTSYMPSFTSTSSVVDPKFYTSESSTVFSQSQTSEPSTSTTKYTGLLKDEPEEEPKEGLRTEEEPKESLKTEEETTEEETTEGLKTEEEPKESLKTEEEPKESLKTEEEPKESLKTEEETTEGLKTEEEPKDNLKTEEEPKESLKTEEETTEGLKTEEEPKESLKTEEETTEGLKTEEEPQKDVLPETESKVKGSKSIVRKDENVKEDDSKESKFPTAQLDQKALDGVSNIPNDFMHIDEDNSVVTRRPEKFSTTTMENEKEPEHKAEKIPLDQGEKSSFNKEKESDN
jgi:hypothetical protein